VADTAERAEDIDAERAEAARRRAEEQLKVRPAAMDLARTTAALQRSMARLKVIERRRRRPGGAPRPGGS
jgi:F-type H+-transporting ATPase subunit epsilon